MPKLMRHDAGRQSERMTDLVKIIAELANERFFGARTGNQPSVGRQWIKRTKKSQAYRQFTNERIDRNHTLRVELSERDMNRPFPRQASVQAIGR